MSASFPHRDHEHLNNAPLTQVVFQVNFSPIFRITKEEPSEFQERVRGRFPKVELLDASTQPPAAAAGGSKAYRFQTADEVHSVTLSADSYVVSSRRYLGWNQFSRDVDLVHAAVEQIYQPRLVARVGLRYINLFTPDNTGRSSVREITELFQAELVAFLSAAMKVSAEDAIVQLVVPDDGANLVLRFMSWSKSTTVLLDIDCYEQREVGMGEVLQWGRRRHDLVYDAFRWCMSSESLSLFRSGSEGR